MASSRGPANVSLPYFANVPRRADQETNVSFALGTQLHDLRPKEQLLSRVPLNASTSQSGLDSSCVCAVISVEEALRAAEKEWISVLQKETVAANMLIRATLPTSRLDFATVPVAHDKNKAPNNYRVCQVIPAAPPKRDLEARSGCGVADDAHKNMSALAQLEPHHVIISRRFLQHWQPLLQNLLRVTVTRAARWVLRAVFRSWSALVEERRSRHLQVANAVTLTAAFLHATLSLWKRAVDSSRRISANLLGKQSHPTIDRYKNEDWQREASYRNVLSQGEVTLKSRMVAASEQRLDAAMEVVKDKQREAKVRSYSAGRQYLLQTVILYNWICFVRDVRHQREIESLRVDVITAGRRQRMGRAKSAMVSLSTHSHLLRNAIWRCWRDAVARKTILMKAADAHFDFKLAWVRVSVWKSWCQQARAHRLRQNKLPSYIGKRQDSWLSASVMIVWRVVILQARIQQLEIVASKETVHQNKCVQVGAEGFDRSRITIRDEVMVEKLSSLEFSRFCMDVDSLFVAVVFTRWAWSVSEIHRGAEWRGHEIDIQLARSQEQDSFFGHALRFLHHRLHARLLRSAWECWFEVAQVPPAPTTLSAMPWTIWSLDVAAKVVLSPMHSRVLVFFLLAEGCMNRIRFYQQTSSCPSVSWIDAAIVVKLRHAEEWLLREAFHLWRRVAAHRSNYDALDAMRTITSDLQHLDRWSDRSEDTQTSNVQQDCAPNRPDQPPEGTLEVRRLIVHCDLSDPKQAFEGPHLGRDVPHWPESPAWPSQKEDQSARVPQLPWMGDCLETCLADRIVPSAKQDQPEPFERLPSMQTSARLTSSNLALLEQSAAVETSEHACAFLETLAQGEYHQPLVRESVQEVEQSRDSPLRRARSSPSRLDSPVRQRSEGSASDSFVSLGKCPWHGSGAVDRRQAEREEVERISAMRAMSESSLSSRNISLRANRVGMGADNSWLNSSAHAHLRTSSLPAREFEDSFTDTHSRTSPLELRRFVLRQFGSVEAAFADADSSLRLQRLSRAQFEDTLARKWRYCNASEASQLFTALVGCGGQTLTRQTFLRVLNSACRPASRPRVRPVVVP
eukprot:CAMPEP_0169286386 /NCGR_PEP_ID=MMETSP1016-20121227/59265_1 /TAXON_ID=342587 /ORGANISM="Karlodinium micrum, Strain CCMP2283" /LENGTH=1078 /DNA_ID=CAMNT_0009376079 /DNA_START=79 /DNA_END=3312 /DNA_ORIENTATION=+